MKNAEFLRSVEQNNRKVISFRTARGSVYTYDTDGKTTRYKTAAIGRGEEPRHNTQDLTVFVRLDTESRQAILTAIHAQSDDPAQNKKIYVLERLHDEPPRIIRDIRDVERPDDLYLAIVQANHLQGAVKASIEPEVGAEVFDTRHYQEDGLWFTERHLGNCVTEIEYAN